MSKTNGISYDLNIPENFDLKALFDNFPPNLENVKLNVSTFKNCDYYIYFIIDLIIQLRTKKNINKAYIEISGKMLNEDYSIKHYTQIMLWLEQAGVIDIDKNYITPEASIKTNLKPKAIGYRLTKEYTTNLKTVTIYKDTFINRIKRKNTDNRLKKIEKNKKRHKKQQENETEILQKLRAKKRINKSDFIGQHNLDRSKRAKQLKLFFNGKISIDFEKVNHVIDKKIEYLKTTEYQNPELLRQILQKPLQKLLTKDVFEFTNFDHNTGRFHSPLTRIHAQLRNFIKYNNQSLASIDFKNSQPAIMSRFLSPEFWETPSGDEFTINTLPDNFIAWFQALNIKEHLNNVLFMDNIVHNYKKSNYYNQLISSQSPLMRPVFKSPFEIADELINKPWINVNPFGFSGLSLKNTNQYTELAVSGKFYDDFANVMNNIEPNNDWVRNEVKQHLMFTLFSSNRSTSFRESFHDRTLIPSFELKTVFKNHYSQVYEVFKSIKRSDKSILSRSAQILESELIYERIVPRIKKELPRAVIATIHDSVVTTTNYTERVQQIMLEESEKALLFTPTFKVEVWSEKNFDFDEFKVMKRKKRQKYQKK